MITDDKKRHYLAVKKLSALLRRITSNHVGDFYCLNCRHSFRTNIHPLVIYCLHIVHVMLQKLNLIIMEVMIA